MCLAYEEAFRVDHRRHCPTSRYDLKAIQRIQKTVLVANIHSYGMAGFN